MVFPRPKTRKEIDHIDTPIRVAHHLLLRFLGLLGLGRRSRSSSFLLALLRCLLLLLGRLGFSLGGRLGSGLSLLGLAALGLRGWLGSWRRGLLLFFLNHIFFLGLCIGISAADVVDSASHSDQFVGRLVVGHRLTSFVGRHLDSVGRQVLLILVVPDLRDSQQQ